MKPKQRKKRKKQGNKKWQDNWQGVSQTLMGVAKSNECDVNTAPPAAAFKTLLLTGTSLIALPDMIGCLDNIRCSWDGVWGGQDPVPPDLRQQMTKLAHLEQRVRSSIGNQVVRQTSRNAKGGGVPDVVKKAVDYLPRMEKQLDDIQLHDILSSDIVASVDTANPDEDACHRIILWRYKLARFKPPTEALNAARWLLCSAGSASELAHRLSYFSVAVNRQMQEEYEQHARAGNADALFAYRDLRNNGRSTLDQRVRRSKQDGRTSASNETNSIERSDAGTDSCAAHGKQRMTSIRTKHPDHDDPDGCGGVAEGLIVLHLEPVRAPRGGGGGDGGGHEQRVQDSGECAGIDANWQAHDPRQPPPHPSLPQVPQSSLPQVPPGSCASQCVQDSGECAGIDANWQAHDPRHPWSDGEPSPVATPQSPADGGQDGLRGHVPVDSTAPTIRQSPADDDIFDLQLLPPFERLDPEALNALLDDLLADELLLHGVSLLAQCEPSFLLDPPQQHQPQPRPASRPATSVASTPRTPAEGADFVKRLDKHMFELPPPPPKRPFRSGPTATTTTSSPTTTNNNNNNNNDDDDDDDELPRKRDKRC